MKLDSKKVDLVKEFLEEWAPLVLINVAFAIFYPILLILALGWMGFEIELSLSSYVGAFSVLLVMRSNNRD